MRLTFENLDGAAGACGRFEADCPNTGDEEDHKRAGEARVPMLKARDIVRGGGACIVFTKAELRELRKAFGNSTADPDWYRDWATNRKALLSVAVKIGEVVTVPNRGPRPRQMR